MATSAMSIGTNAIHEAKTSASTSSAPPPAISASTAMLAPLPSAVGGARRAARRAPVTLTGAPPTVTPATARLRRARLGLAGVDAAARRDVDEREGRAAVLRRRSSRSSVEAYEATRECGTAP